VTAPARRLGIRDDRWRLARMSIAAFDLFAALFAALFVRRAY
jgi:hypothetical protein